MIISATLSAVTTDKYSFGHQDLPITFGAMGLVNGEEITIQFTNDGGTTWEDLYLSGSKVVFSNTDKVKTIYAPMDIRFVKLVTANPASLGSMIRDINEKRI